MDTVYWARCGSLINRTAGRNCLFPGWQSSRWFWIATSSTLNFQLPTSTERYQAGDQTTGLQTKLESKDKLIETRLSILSGLMSMSTCHMH